MRLMSITLTGVVKNGVVVPAAALPEGAQVEIRLNETPTEKVPTSRPTPAELRKMPREERQIILAAAAEMAEQDYRSDKELTGFEAFSEEERNNDESGRH
jgi:hypothetical protein